MLTVFFIVSFNLVPKLDSDLLTQPGWVMQLFLDWKYLQRKHSLACA